MGQPNLVGRLKTALRRQARQRLDSLSVQTRQRQSQAIRTALLASPWFQAAKTVVAFIPMADEPDILPLLELAGAGRIVGLVRINQKQTIQVCPYNGPATPLEQVDGWRVSQPAKNLAPINNLTAPGPVLILVPGLAFDKQGYRLGRGQGWYDRLLSDWQTGRADVWAVGVAFGIQVVEKLPKESHDRRLDGLATDLGVSVILKRL